MQCFVIRSLGIIELVQGIDLLPWISITHVANDWSEHSVAYNKRWLKKAGLKICEVKFLYDDWQNS